MDSTLGKLLEALNLIRAEILDSNFPFFPSLFLIELRLGAKLWGKESCLSLLL
jgi:hypothetical protein